MKKDFGGIFGFVAALLFIFGIAISEVLLEISTSIKSGLGDKVGPFIDIDSLVIVFGGSLSALVINFKFEDMKKFGTLLWQSLTAPSEGEEAETIAQIVDLSQEARVNGLLALESKIKKIESDFMRNGLEMVVDGTDSDTIRESLENELAYIQKRHSKGQQMFLQWGMFLPSFGMIGTLIGLVKMMGNLDGGMQAIGAGMSVALLTTFWGSLLANALALPLAGKLQIMSNEEVILKELMIEGILSIPKGENPKVLKRYLDTFIPPKRRVEQNG